jgi:hypothetical protein
MSDTTVWEPLAGRVLALLRAGDHAGAYDALEREAPAVTAGDPAADRFTGFRKVSGLLYWTHRALPEYVALCLEHIRRVEAALAGAAGEERAALVKTLGGTYYNVASFTWPGWDEKDVAPGPAEVQIGREAALRCLEIRIDPANADVAFGYTVSMARWVAGAHHLPHNPELARQQFALARALDLETGQDDTLNAGYLALVDLMEGRAEAAEEAWDSVMSILEDRAPADEDAVFCRNQLLTARRFYLGEG